jgi:hypothetical protein
MLATDAAEFPLMEIREISLHTAETSDLAEAVAEAPDG